MRSKPGGSGDVRPPPPGHHLPIYCDSAGIGVFFGGGGISGIMGHMEIMGKGKPRLGECEDVGKSSGVGGRGVNGRGGGARQDEIMMGGVKLLATKYHRDGY